MKKFVFIMILMGSLANSADRAGGGGQIAAPKFKTYALRAFDELLKNKITQVESIRIADLKDHYSKVAIVEVKSKPKWNGIPRDAIYDDATKTVSVWESWPNSAPEDILLNSVHEAVRVYNDNVPADQRVNDDGYHYSRSIVSKVNLGQVLATAQEAQVQTWTITNETTPQYRTLDEAIATCRTRAEALIQSYKYVTCEPLVQTKQKILTWNEVIYTQQYEGKTTEYSYRQYRNSGYSSFTGALLTPFYWANGKFTESWSTSSVNENYKETPVFTTQPRTIERRDTQDISLYGFRVLVHTRLIANSSPDEMLFDAYKEQLLKFTTPRASLDDCGTYTMSLRRLEFDARCVNYEIEPDVYSYRVIGKPKYTNLR